MSKVMVIDDSVFARNLIRKILKSEGYDICAEAANGKEGFDVFKLLKPDLVFCDIMMDEMDGFECLKAMLEENPSANVVICTSMSDELHVKEALAMGAKEFLPKPINAKELLRITKKLLGSSKGGKKTYKELIDERAEEKGIEPKLVLDFYAAFRQFTGYDIENKKIDEKFLKDNDPGIRIGVRALLAAKMPSDQAESIINVFESLYM